LDARELADDALNLNPCSSELMLCIRDTIQRESQSINPKNAFNNCVDTSYPLMRVIAGYEDPILNRFQE
jgi:hypothetical protein